MSTDSFLDEIAFQNFAKETASKFYNLSDKPLPEELKSVQYQKTQYEKARIKIECINSSDDYDPDQQKYQELSVTRDIVVEQLRQDRVLLDKTEAWAPGPKHQCVKDSMIMELRDSIAESESDLATLDDYLSLPTSADYKNRRLADEHARAAGYLYSWGVAAKQVQDRINWAREFLQSISGETKEH